MIQAVKNILILKDKNILNTANFFWEGVLTPYEELCIKSFINNGFYVNLWTYSTKISENLKKLNQFSLKDAKEIMPQ